MSNLNIKYKDDSYLKSICRTCLVENENMSNLYDVDNQSNITLAEMLYECTSIQVAKSDAFPKNVCEKCIQQIICGYEFKLNCLKAEEEILKYINRSEKLHIKTETNDDDYDDLPLLERLTKTEKLSNDKSDQEIPMLENVLPWFLKEDKDYKCTLCGEIMPILNDLRDHVVTEHGDVYSFQCIECRAIFTKKCSLKHHKCRRWKNKKKINELFRIEDDDHKTRNILLKQSLKTFPCSLCEKVYSNQNSLNKHLRTVHNQQSQYKCDLCPGSFHSKHFHCKLCVKSFETQDALELHVSEKHKYIKNHSARSTCGKSFVLRSNLNTHLRKHTREKPFVEHKQMSTAHKTKNENSLKTFPCPLCERLYSNQNSLNKHLRTVHNQQRQYKCDLCPGSFHSKNSLLGHRRVHGEKSGFHCKFCIHSFETQDALKSHVNEQHRDAVVHKCHLCDKEFYVKEYLLKHIKNHSAKPTHLCTICGKCFLISSNLTTHLRIHTGEKPYVCEVCNASFAQHTSLRFHQTIHSNERRFECEICGLKLKLRSVLLRHKLIHSTESNYNCNFCQKKFISKSGLTTHIKIHTGEKKFQCQICSKHFMRSSHLKVHSRIHTGERPYVCSVCGKAFIQNNCLISHTNTHHRNKTL